MEIPIDFERLQESARQRLLGALTSLLEQREAMREDGHKTTDGALLGESLLALQGSLIRVLEEYHQELSRQLSDRQPPPGE